MLVLTGGFLGSGKTTAILNACKYLVNRNMKVAVITNDQGTQQVDHAFIQAMGLMVKQVGNGCFCCQYNELESHLQYLENNEQPDFIFAESVGSCTDLVATIVKPLFTRKPDLKVMVSVFADASFLNALMEGRKLFKDESIRYLYKKQLEEADRLVINKTDLVTAAQLTMIDQVIKKDYPDKIVLHQNSLKDVSAWITNIEAFKMSDTRHSLQIDYNLYGDAESKLAWLDKSMIIKAPLGNGAFIARTLISSIFSEIHGRGFSIGHLKFFLAGKDWSEKISFTASSTNGDVKIRHENVFQLRVMINARVLIEPDRLKQLIAEVIDALRDTNMCSFINEQEEVFKPGYPKPMYRIL